MAQPASRADLINYAKRQLGAPVLEINVADEQVEDILDDSIQYFQERHFDGVERTYMKYKLTQADIDRGTANLGENTKYISSRNAKQKNNESLDSMKTDLDNLKGEINEIKSLLKELVNGN